MAQYKTFSTMAQDDAAPNPSDMVEVPRITSLDQRRALVQGNLLVVVDNYTDWCGPCKQCAPSFAAMAGKYSKPGVCAFAKENVEDKCGGWPVPVRGVPCFHFYMNGQFLQDDIVTGADVGQVEQTVQRLLASGSRNYAGHR